MEVDCAKAAMHMLVEKPISMRPAEEVERLAQVHHKCYKCPEVLLLHLTCCQVLLAL